MLYFGYLSMMDDRDTYTISISEMYVKSYFEKSQDIVKA